MKLSKLFISLSFFFVAITSHAEEIKIKSFSMLMDPMTTEIQRKDNNGQICALVKVIIPSPQAVFEGNLVGQSDYKTSEYWCYLTPGSKFLKIKYPGFTPLMINYETLMGRGVEGKRIYELYLDIPAKDTGEKLPFNMSGNIIFEGLSEKSLESYSIYEKIYPHLKIYVNYHNGKYKQVIDTASIKQGSILNKELKYTLQGVNIGDSITVTHNNPTYQQYVTIPITMNRLGSGKTDIFIPKKRINLPVRIVDGRSKAPIPGVKVFEDYNKTGFTGITNEDGEFILKDYLPNTKKKVYFSDLPYGYKHYDYDLGRYSGKGYDGETIIDIFREESKSYIKASKDLSPESITAVSNDGREVRVNKEYGGNYIVVSYEIISPEEAPTIIINTPGYKTIELHDVVKPRTDPIKMKRGLETSRIVYKNVNGKVVKEEN